MELTVAFRERWPIHRHLVVVLQQVLVVDQRLRTLPADGRGKQLLGQNDPGSLPLVSTVTAEADLLEAVARCDHPGVIHRAAQSAAKVFEDSRIACRLRDEVIERLVPTRDDASSSDVMPKDAAVHHLGEERSLRDELIQKMRDVLLAFDGEGLLITRSASKGDDDCAWL